MTEREIQFRDIAPGDRLYVASAVAAMHGDPRISSAWTSQLLSGHVVHVIESRDAWVRVRSEDQYEGWMHRGYLAASNGDEESWRVSLGCRIAEERGERELPLLARVSPSARLINGALVEAAELPTRFPQDSAAISSSAGSLFAGASYVWGGVSPWGCDCSGFTQSIFGLHGIPMPRDAAQQAKSFGTLDRNAPIDSLSPGMLAFFTDRDDQHITHVGIMLGSARMAHSGLGRGGFNIESFLDDSDVYVAKLRANYVGGVSALG